MANRMPSFLALLGLAAAAGYQNRDSLRQMIGNLGQTGADTTPRDAVQGGWLDVIIDRARHSLGGASPLAAGLSELADRFSGTGKGEIAQSWVGRGQNMAVTPQQVRDAAGPEVIAELVRQTGLSEGNVLSRLAQSLPELVDQATPDGRLPDDRFGASAAVAPSGTPGPWY